MRKTKGFFSLLPSLHLTDPLRFTYSYSFFVASWSSSKKSSSERIFVPSFRAFCTFVDVDSGLAITR